MIGLDLSWPMLRYAAAKSRELGVANLTLLHGDAHALPFADASLDAANCCGALHLFPDWRQVLAELGRVIRPKGRFAAAVFLEDPGEPGRLRRRYDAAMGVHRFRPEELAAELDTAGFEPAVHHAKGVWMVAGGLRRA